MKRCCLTTELRRIVGLLHAPSYREEFANDLSKEISIARFGDDQRCTGPVIVCEKAMRFATPAKTTLVINKFNRHPTQRWTWSTAEHGVVDRYKMTRRAAPQRPERLV